jgi:TrkA-C domain
VDELCAPIRRLWTGLPLVHIPARDSHSHLHRRARSRAGGPRDPPQRNHRDEDRSCATVSAVTAILTLLIVVALSLVVTRVATVALTATGLSREAARFQARSAFSGAGFTTSESESVVRHPVRRRIIMWLMLAGNAGIVAVIASIVLAAVAPGDDWGTLLNVAVVIAGIFIIWRVSGTDWVDRRITRLAGIALRRWTRLDVHDYAALLHVGGEYIVTELDVERGSWLADRSIAGLALRDEGVIVLGVERPDGSYLGVPQGRTVLVAGDVLIVYSRSGVLAELDQRRRGASGEAAHAAAVREQARVIADEQSAGPAQHEPAGNGERDAEPPS